MADDDIFDVTGTDSNEPVVERTILDALQNELRQVVRNEPITLVVPTPPPIS